MARMEACACGNESAGWQWNDAGLIHTAAVRAADVPEDKNVREAAAAFSGVGAITANGNDDGFEAWLREQLE